ncbi:Aminotransferase, DegT/DnrJ/EryC1/StrS family [hydrothermal vent metagenome]|uniref:Aminotransferase, DegT/DnrJ/EryC1/StrS family n=1 Tax=hydrothermal vent metagenome TaxID=652676 RepID=A0A3B1BBK8_9ZZZZ
MKRINVTKAQIPNRERFFAYIDGVLDSGWLTNQGQLVNKLETRLAEYLGVCNVVLTTNGTLSLLVAYRILGLQREVITTPFTFIATASSLVWGGLDVVFADVDRRSFNIDIEDIKEKITPKTSAIVPVHVFGNPCDVEAIDSIAKSHDLKVIYDAAHAFGVQYKGKSILNWGDISVLSFHATKVFHTIEGGALIINDDELAQKARKTINLGITGPESIECLGINGKMSEFQAAMGHCLLDEMEAVIVRRAALVEIYDSLLENVVQKQSWMEGEASNNNYYPILLADEMITKKVQAVLNENNIYPRRYFYPALDTFSFLTKENQMPVAKDIASRILCLPLFTELSHEDCQRIAKIVIEVIGAK